MIINRLLVTEITKTFIATNVILVVIATSTQLVSIMGHVAGGDVSSGLLFRLIALQIPELFAFLLPLSLFIAIILSLGKAFVDNELTVLFACGLTWGRLTMLILGLATAVMLICAYLNLAVIPNLIAQKKVLIETESPTLMLEAMKPSRFYTIQNGKMAFYVEKMGGHKGELQDVFIAEVPSHAPGKSNPWTVMTAKQGKITLDADSERAHVMLINGKRYDGAPGAQDYTVVYYDSYERILGKGSLAHPQKSARDRHTMSSKELFSSKEKLYQSEFQWRLAIPLSAPILAIFALAFSRVSPRAGRFSKFFPAIIIFIFYYNVLTIAKRGIASGWLSPELGLWWVHGIMLLLSLMMLASVSGRFNQGLYYLRSRSKKGSQ